MPKPPSTPSAPSVSTLATLPEVRPGQSVELLKELHILTREGKLNQDSRRKLKQVYHLVQFIEPLLREVLAAKGAVTLADHGAGKSYLGFILYDLFFKALPPAAVSAAVSTSVSAATSPAISAAAASHLYGIETREELVQRSRELATRLGFPAMSFLNLTVAQSITSSALPAGIDVVTALHACDTATDDAIRFALEKKARHIVVVPCCQAEVASVLRKNKGRMLATPAKNALTEIWRRPVHTREFGSQITNVLRCLQLEAHGYQVTVTELTGWEHSMKNELIIASFEDLPRKQARERLREVLEAVGLEEMSGRFAVAAG